MMAPSVRSLPTETTCLADVITLGPIGSSGCWE